MTVKRLDDLIININNLLKFKITQYGSKQYPIALTIPLADFNRLVTNYVQIRDDILASHPPSADIKKVLLSTANFRKALDGSSSLIHSETDFKSLSSQIIEAASIINQAISRIVSSDVATARKNFVSHYLVVPILLLPDKYIKKVHHLKAALTQFDSVFKYCDIRMVGSQTLLCLLLTLFSQDPVFTANIKSMMEQSDFDIKICVGSDIGFSDFHNLTGPMIGLVESAGFGAQIGKTIDRKFLLTDKLKFFNVTLDTGVEVVLTNVPFEPLFSNCHPVLSLQDGATYIPGPAGLKLLSEKKVLFPRFEEYLSNPRMHLSALAYILKSVIRLNHLGFVVSPEQSDYFMALLSQQPITESFVLKYQHRIGLESIPERLSLLRHDGVKEEVALEINLRKLLFPLAQCKKDMDTLQVLEPISRLKVDEEQQEVFEGIFSMFRFGVEKNRLLSDEQMARQQIDQELGTIHERLESYRLSNITQLKARQKEREAFEKVELIAAESVGRNKIQKELGTAGKRLQRLIFLDRSESLQKEQGRLQREADQKKMREDKEKSRQTAEQRRAKIAQLKASKHTESAEEIAVALVLSGHGEKACVSAAEARRIDVAAISRPKAVTMEYRQQIENLRAILFDAAVNEECGKIITLKEFVPLTHDPKLIFLNRTPLFVACAMGKKAAVVALLAMGAPAHHVCENNYTPIYAAAKEGHHKIVELLLRNDANPNFPCFSNQTPLIIAAHEDRDGSHINVIKLLLASRAEVDHKSVSGASALLIAVLHNKLEVVKWLIAYGSKCVYQDHQMRDGKVLNPMSIAITKRDAELFRVLRGRPEEMRKELESSPPKCLDAESPKSLNP